ncbi:kinase-like domain-containing protein [Mycena rebaudengoi]|nr:kinase-like domain-containing protein [Mycena rebaudengoi]
MARNAAQDYTLRPLDIQGNHTRGRNRVMSLHAPPRTGNRRYVRDNEQLGSGRYSKVVTAIDVVSANKVAVKIMDKTRTTTSDFLREVRVLQKLAQLRPSPFGRFVILLDYYSTQEENCIISERYACSLSSVLADRQLAPLLTFQCAEIALQAIQAVDYLHMNGIIHTDINPRNIVLVDATRGSQIIYTASGVFKEKIILKCTEIRIIDFGSVGENVTVNVGIVGSPGYRSPEIILGDPLTAINPGWEWTCVVDHFALGCVIAELALSRPLLPNTDQSVVEDLQAMEDAIGAFPEDMREKINEERSNTCLLGPEDYRNEDTKAIKILMKNHILCTTVTQLTQLDPDDRPTLQERTELLT